MARVLTYGWLFVVAPTHFGMGLTLVHPALNRSDLFGLALLGAGALFVAVAVGLSGDGGETSWAWCRRRLHQFYAFPVAALALVHSGWLVHGGAELGLVVQELRPASGTDHPGVPAGPAPKGWPRNTPPASPWPLLRRVAALVWLVLRAAVTFLAVLVLATPAWIYVLAFGWGLMRRQR